MTAIHDRIYNSVVIGVNNYVIWLLEYFIVRRESVFFKDRISSVNILLAFSRGDGNIVKYNGCVVL